MNIRKYLPVDLPDFCRLWNLCVEAGEVVYYPATEAYLTERIFSDPNDVLPYTFAAEEDGKTVGFICGVCQKTYLPGETNENTPGYIVAIMVDPAYRRRGIASALLETLSQAFCEAGKRKISFSGTNPINLEWRIPGTPGHDHNNAPGMDADCPGYPFLVKHGFSDDAREVAMYLNLSEYSESPLVREKQEALKAEGIMTGRYDCSLHYDFDRMCDRVGSEYWRKVLQDETAKENPRVILAATYEDHIVGFTGPVDRQKSGRGWFTGICTDPEFEGRGIATVLFNLLMQEFIAIGADFSTLFTGEENWAQKVYRRAGFRPVRKFSYMSKPLYNEGGKDHA